MPYADLGDVNIHYEHSGSGSPTYVFCHGGGGNGNVFMEHFPFWKQYFPSVLTWDNRGVGLSSQTPKYALPLYASDLAQLLKYLSIDQAVIHGVSWGGVLAQQFALDYPNKCSALILDSSSSEVNLQASENWYNRGEIARLGAQAEIGGFRPAFSGHTASAKNIQSSGMKVLPQHIDSYIAIMRTLAGLREHPLTHRLKDIQCPVLIVGAGRDSTAGAGGSVIMARNIPNCHLEIFQESEHGVYRHMKNEFRELVLEFCREKNIIQN